MQVAARRGEEEERGAGTGDRLAVMSTLMMTTTSTVPRPRAGGGGGRGGEVRIGTGYACPARQPAYLPVCHTVSASQRECEVVPRCEGPEGLFVPPAKNCDLSSVESRASSSRDLVAATGSRQQSASTLNRQHSSWFMTRRTTAVSVVRGGGVQTSNQGLGLSVPGPWREWRRLAGDLFRWAVRECAAIPMGHEVIQ